MPHRSATSAGPSLLLLLAMLLALMLGRPRLLGAAPAGQPNSTAGRSVSKRDYFGLPSAPQLGEAPGRPGGPAYWLGEDELRQGASPGRHRRVQFTKDLSRRTWELLERRNRPDAVAARRAAAARRRGPAPGGEKGREADSAAAGPQFPPMEEKPFRQTSLFSTAQMFKRLGPHNYDMAFTRIVQPREAREHPKGRVVFPGRSGRKVPKSVRAVVRRFAHLLYEGHHKHRLHQRASRLDRKTRRNLRKFLSFYTACPVKYQWKDYGARFWPRWVKTGRCYETGRSCSIPPGMHCQPHRQKVVTLLRYICLDSWKADQCGWKIMNLPILLSCKCGCFQRDS